MPDKKSIPYSQAVNNYIASLPPAQPAPTGLLASLRSRVFGPPQDPRLSPDIEDRRFDSPNAAPSLVDQIRSGLNTFDTKAKMAWQAVQGKDPYTVPGSTVPVIGLSGQLGTAIQPPAMNAQNQPIPGAQKLVR